MKKVKNIAGLAILFAALFLASGCKKASNTPSVTGTVPIVVTGYYSNLLINTVIFTGDVTSDGGSVVTKRGFCSSKTNPDPTIANDTIASGNGTGTFTGTVKGMKGQTLYYIRAYATNSIGTSYGTAVNVTTIDTTLADIENNHYRLVQIGQQVWMAENLRVGHYRNGDAIPYVPDPSLSWAVWHDLTTGAYCWYNTSSSIPYGALYNFYVVADPRNLAPTGWHVPSSAEFKILTDLLGGTNTAGGKLKEIGYAHWQIPNTGASNETGFNALPGGQCSFTGNIENMGAAGNWWTMTELDSGSGHSLVLNYDSNIANPNAYYKTCGYRVRCVRD